MNNFNINNVIDMSCIFSGCSSLKEINMHNFNINNVNYKSYMFSRCSNELKKKIKEQFKDLIEKIFG